MQHVHSNSLAFHPQFDGPIEKQDLIPLIDELLITLAGQDDKVMEVLKQDIPNITELAGLEVDLAKEMTANFNKEAEKIFKKGLRRVQARAAKKGLKRFTKTEVDAFIKGLGPEFAKLDLGMQKQIVATMGAFYRYARNTPIIGRVGFKPVFNLVDRKAQDMLEKNMLFWIGEHYDSSVKSMVKESALNDMVRSGLGRVEAGRRLERNFERYIRNGTIPKGITVPKGFVGSSSEYFTGLVANARNRATTMGRIVSYQQIGIETYEVVAVMDHRTSEVCQTMNGTIFNTSWATDTIEKVVGAQTPSDIKNTVGWKRAPEIQSIAGINKPSDKISPDGAHALHQAGLDMPPYHFRCRTTVVASSESELVVTGVDPPPIPPPVPKRPRGIPKPVTPPSRAVPGQNIEGLSPDQIRELSNKELDTLYASQISEFESATAGLSEGSKAWETAWDTKFRELLRRSGGKTRNVRGLTQDLAIDKVKKRTRKSPCWGKRFFSGRQGSKTQLGDKMKKFDKRIGRYWTKQAEESVVLKDLEIHQRGTNFRAFHREAVKGRGAGIDIVSQIHVGRHSRLTTYTHEFGHHIEKSNKIVLKESKRFLNRRTRGEAAKPLNELLPYSGYDATEVAKKNKFFHPYCGRIYSHDSTEIVSMGLDEFYKNPMRFYQTDKDYFSFILGIVRGEVTRAVPK